MGIVGIESVTYGVLNLSLCKRYFEDWGLRLVKDHPQEAELACLNDSRIRLIPSDTPGVPAGVERDPTIREVVWGVQTSDDLETLSKSLSRFSKVSRSLHGFSTTDPNGLTISFRVSSKKDVPPSDTEFNTWGSTRRIDRPSPVYDRATPADIAHVVFHTQKIAEVERWYTQGLGFHLTDRYPGRGIFLRCSARGGHHNIFFIQMDNKNPKLDHLAFTVRDIHEIFGGGIHFGRKGWQTELGPGRHPISSAYFWYFQCPAGGKTEYTGDEDYFSENWKARDFEPSPQNFAEWASNGDVDIQRRKGGSVAAAEANAASIKAAS